MKETNRSLNIDKTVEFNFLTDTVLLVLFSTFVECGSSNRPNSYC